MANEISAVRRERQHFFKCQSVTDEENAGITIILVLSSIFLDSFVFIIKAKENSVELLLLLLYRIQHYLINFFAISG